jgi:hypothetical protein
VIVDPATSILAVRAAAVLIALFGSGTALTIGGQLFSQDEVTKAVSVLITGLLAVYGAARTFRRGRLTPTSEHVIDLKNLRPADITPKVQAMIADIERTPHRG